MKAEELFEIIKSRRTVMPNRYSDEEITAEELNQILESANWAPTHKRTEPWRFRVIEGEALKKFSEFMIELYEENTAENLKNDRKRDQIREKCLKSNKIVLICMKTSNLLPEWEELAAVSAAVQNMWLMCTAMNIGSYWATPGAISKIDRFTELEEGEKCIGIFYMGKLNAPMYEGFRNPLAEKLKFISE